MNIELLSTFQQNYPEEFDGTLDCASMAVCCAFNKIGSMLAVGCSDGRLVIWDFLTRGIAKIICADWSPIYSISWSKKSDLIATSSTDNTVCIWYTATGRCHTRISCIQSPILRVQFHPRNSSYLLICPMKHPPVLIDNNGKHTIVTIDDEPNDIISTFDRKGEHIILGNNRGLIVVKTFPDLKTISSFRITTGTNANTVLRHIEIPRRGQYCLINTSDRIIRIYNYTDMLSCGIVRDLEPKQKLQDLVNKSLWRKCCWSGDGEYICGASSRQHSLYIWETISGNLVKILHGTKGETLADVCWHPVRPIIASISSGVVSIWSHSQVENWSAFAPDFRELEENVEYHERESEFDIKDEDRSLDSFDYINSPNKRQRLDMNGNIKKINNDDIEIDVVTEQRIEALVSSDDDDINDQLVYLPSAPDIEDPEIESSSSTTTTTTTKNQILTHNFIETDQKYEIQLQTPPVYDTHPYYGGTKQTRSIGNIILNNQDIKKDGRHRRKGHHNESDQQNILLPKSIDAAVATLTNNSKRFISTNGNSTIVTQTTENKGQRGRSARLEGKKTTTGQHRSSTDNDIDFVPH
ncbi:unnamed protein product [Rotaria sordida]|uniref:Uncharacterized protein n=1 Tax=Rotaria sordida TaxID=392033 RepID=A0A813VBA9_9BILA|nr:unnamed protein product [Rotaria sordida]CAF0995801.1 unnamed protein product [Rotaria sordida]CAF1010161.1 unnamed protein product [Rotaria sordida]CAF1167627.1 unnamed protein product [Rotaria sordida]CAF3748057.1 unnamed protein product [Rotaria sordida]